VATLNSLDRQLRLLRGFAFATYPFACAPFLFLYFARHGLDQAAYGEVIATYYLAMFLAEVPTGVLADRFGPRLMLVLGPVLLAAGFGLLLLQPDYAGFLAGEALLGIAHAVLSGPPATMLYETLREHGVSHRYLAEEARCNRNRLCGTGVAFLIGGCAARFGNSSGDAFGLTIAATCLGNLCAAAIALAMRPEPGRPALRPGPFLRQVRSDLGQPAVRWLLFYWIVLFALLRYPFHNYQPYLQEAATLDPRWRDPLAIGVLFALLNLAAAPLSGKLPWLVDRLGRRCLFHAMPLVLAGSLLVMAAERHAAAQGDGSVAFLWLGIAMFFVQQVPFGMHTALVAEFVNHRIDHRARTTVASTLSLAARLAYAGCNVLLFRSQQTHGMATTLAVAGLGGGGLALLVMWCRPRGLLRGEPTAHSDHSPN
jgi:MFS family permease